MCHVCKCLNVTISVATTTLDTIYEWLKYIDLYTENFTVWGDEMYVNTIKYESRLLRNCEQTYEAISIKMLKTGKLLIPVTGKDILGVPSFAGNI